MVDAPSGSGQVTGSTGSLAAPWHQARRTRGPDGARYDGASDKCDDRGSMGAEAEFTALYQARFGDLAAQLYAYTGDTGEAQEVVQEAFLRAWQRWQQIGRYDDPVAWVRRVAWNLATSRHRKVAVFRRFAAKIAAADHEKPVGPERVALVNALRKIPEQHRRALVLHYLADLSVADIAHEVAVAEGTVKSWLHRGRAELAKHLTDDPFAGPDAGGRIAAGHSENSHRPPRQATSRSTPAGKTSADKAPADRTAAGKAPGDITSGGGANGG